MLVRDGDTGPEVLLTYRQSPLAMIGFAGGTVTPGDADDLAWFGRPLREWAHQLQLSDYSQIRATVVAGIRELFERTGYLLAGPDETTLTQDHMRARLALAHEDATFATVLNRRGWGVRTDLLRPLAVFDSPEFALERFSTTYFVAAEPTGQSHSVLEDSQSWLAWVDVNELVEKQHTSWLGDLVQKPLTVGQPMAAISHPAIILLCEQLAAASGAAAYLLGVSPRTRIKSFISTLSDDDRHLIIKGAP